MARWTKGICVVCGKPFAPHTLNLPGSWVYCSQPCSEVTMRRPAHWSLTPERRDRFFAEMDAMEDTIRRMNAGEFDEQYAIEKAAHDEDRARGLIVRCAS